MIFYWAVAALAVLMAIASLLGEEKRALFVPSRLPAPEPSRFAPATVIVPVKGHDHNLASNLEALAAQDYTDFELIVCARSREDIPTGVVPAKARVVLAHGVSAGGSEKIDNLIAAVAAARPRSEIYAFADSDGLVRPDWLRGLAAALEEPGAGASTGYRWHAPRNGGAWSLLRSVWNSVIAGGFGPGDNRFAWGGGMAMRREDFDTFSVAEYWKGAISDDYRLSEAVHDAGKTIAFAPAAMVASEDETTARDFLEWSRRQMMITRFYAVRLWWLGLAAHIVYCGAMAGSAVLAARGETLALAALLIQLALGMWKGHRRAALIRETLPKQADWFRKYGWTHSWLTPAATWLWLWSFVASGFGSTIAWRGRRYRLQRLPKCAARSELRV